MTHGFVPFRQIAALSAVIALFSSPTDAAQTPVPAAAGDAPAPTIVLNSAAFARLVKVTQPDTGSALDVKDVKAVPRLASLPHNPMTTVRRTEASVAHPPPRSRGGQKVVAVIVVVGLIAGALALSAYTGADFDQVLEGLFQWVSK